MKKLVILFVLFFSTSFFLKAQLYKEQGWGIEGIYNLPTEGFGVALRYQIHLTGTFVAVPKIDYYLPFNDVHELLIGADIQARIQSWRNWGPYLLVGPYYDHWINYDESPDPNAALSNFTLEAGLGFTRNYGCIRPYAEYRFNTKYQESNIRLGVAFYLNYCNKNAPCLPIYK